MLKELFIDDAKKMVQSRRLPYDIRYGRFYAACISRAAADSLVQLFPVFCKVRKIKHFIEIRYDFTGDLFY